MRSLGFWFLIIFCAPNVLSAQEEGSLYGLAFSLVQNEVLLVSLGGSRHIIVVKAPLRAGVRTYLVQTNPSDPRRSFDDVESVRRISWSDLEEMQIDVPALKLSLDPEHYDQLRKALFSGDPEAFEGCRPTDLRDCQSSSQTTRFLSGLGVFDLTAISAAIAFGQFFYSVYRLTLSERLTATVLSMATSALAIDVLTRWSSHRWAQHIRLSRFNDPQAVNRWWKVAAVSAALGSVVSCPLLLKTFSDNRHSPRNGPPSIRITPQELAHERVLLERRRDGR